MIGLWASLFPTAGQGQPSFKKITSITLDSEVTYATVDRPGELYVVLKDGTVQRRGTAGEQLATHTFTVAPTLFEARDGARIFVYFSASQTYAFLNPALEDSNGPYKIDRDLAIDPFLVCTTGDHNLIVLDSADWSLRKVDGKTFDVLMEISLQKDLSNRNITLLREYQGFIFMLDPAEGILIFNGMGKLLRVLRQQGLEYFNFLGEELYYLKNDAITLLDLSSGTTRSIPLPARASFALLTDERLYLAKGRHVEIFAFKP